MKGLSLSLAATLLAAGAAGGALLARAPARAEAAPATTYLETLVLLRWGHGALDWLLPPPEGGKENGRD